jgi:hypothetical protein
MAAARGRALGKASKSKMRDEVSRARALRGGLAAEYLAFLRDEPRARAYLVATLVDEIGVALSAWAGALLMTNLFTTQRARASLMLPTLMCFLLGALISGPLADWRADTATAVLARWRWRVLLWGRGIETALLAGLALELAFQPPTIGRVLPYAMVSAFMKTGLRSTRIAFSVDLLEKSERALVEGQSHALDERGRPLEYKTYLGTLTAASSLLSTLATLVGLFIGGQVLALVGGRLSLPFAADVFTNLAFCWLLWRRCSPLQTAPAPAEQRPAGPPSLPILRRFWQSHAEVVRFLAVPAQRPLLALLVGSWLVEVITEAYDGKMITKHVLHGTDDAVRYAELGWTLIALLGSALLPIVLRRIASIGKIFCVTMSLDALCIAGAGLVAAAGAPAAILPFVAVLSIDRSLTLASTALTDVAQNSLSSTMIRGRIAGTYALVVIAGDMASEALAVTAEERWGIPGLLLSAGAFQAALVGVLFGWGGRRLWNYGLRPV